MIRDLDRSASLVVSADVCVVGAGPAGIVLALTLASAGIDVVLLERGGLGAAWGGRAAPFDAQDFEVRAHVPESGWPIDRSALEPYYRAAHAHCDLGPFSYLAEEALPDGAARRPFIPGLDAEEIAADGLYLWSAPVDFGARHRKALSASRRIQLFLHAECTRLVVDRDGGRVTLAEATSLTGGRLLVAARRFVLAGGGLEVTRLLFRSDDVHRGGIGNHRDQLGRHYMRHLVHRFEIEVRSPEVVWDHETTRHGVHCQRTLAVRPDRQREEGLQNHRACIEHPDLADPAHQSGVLSAAYLLQSRLGSRGALQGEQRRSVDLVAHLGNVGRDALAVMRFGRRWLRARVIERRPLPSITLKSPDGVYTLRLDLEQAPNPSSRVTLGGERDALGQRCLRVDWRSTDLDAWSAVRAAALIGKALSRSGAGRLRALPGFRPEATGGPPLGTTRMSADPGRGVVDERCRVHGVHNLFIASSSVFPTSSYADPTLTVLALTLRLADHLKAQREAVLVRRREAEAQG